MKRELSTAPHNVVRRQMRVTPFKTYRVKCPDCGSSPMNLWSGRWGRFYKCLRLDCHGTRGARLDGRTCKETGSRALKDARRRARDTVFLVVLQRFMIAQRRVAEKRMAGEILAQDLADKVDRLARDRFGVGGGAADAIMSVYRDHDWWNEHHVLSGCQDDFREIVFAAKLPPVHVRERRRVTKLAARICPLPPVHPVGLFLRRRSIEECERVVIAATEHLRKLRGHAWDRVLVGTLDETEVEPEPKQNRGWPTSFEVLFED